MDFCLRCRFFFVGEFKTKICANVLEHNTWIFTESASDISQEVMLMMRTIRDVDDDNDNYDNNNDNTEKRKEKYFKR